MSINGRSITNNCLVTADSGADASHITFETWTPKTAKTFGLVNWYYDFFYHSCYIHMIILYYIHQKLVHSFNIHLIVVYRLIMIIYNSLVFYSVLQALIIASTVPHLHSLRLCPRLVSLLMPSNRRETRTPDPESKECVLGKGITLVN